VQHMNGQRALVYSRIRVNLLDPSENDLARARRQQDVVRATADKLTTLWSLMGLPFTGDSVVRPLATDLSAWQILQLGWAYKRADVARALHCRLGGSSATVGGQSVIVGSEDNVETVAMFLGKTAPQRPPAGQTNAPGCAVGERNI
jgi:anionic cell wall polymer biosynthesis LytR-Cps2A-Psr (LCP) family protein